VAKSRSFVNTLTNRTALTEILKLHIVEEELPSDYIYNRSLLTVCALGLSQIFKFQFRLFYTQLICWQFMN